MVASKLKNRHKLPFAFALVFSVVLVLLLLVIKSSTVLADFNSVRINDQERLIYANEGRSIFLSPDRKLLAVTVRASESGTFSYIADVEGKALTKSFPGSFSSWAPDNSKILVYLSDPPINDGKDGEDGRRIYYLSVKGEYTDSGLPPGTTGADISLADGSIVYTLAERGIDEMNIMVRDARNNDRVILEGDRNIFAWVRWVENGSKIAFLKSDLSLSENSREIGFFDLSTKEEVIFSEVNWSYPPIESLDGRLIFTKGSNVFEYKLSDRLLRSLTSIERGYSTQPSIAGNEITFMLKDADRRDEIWKIKEDGTLEEINVESVNGYPISL